MTDPAIVALIAGACAISGALGGALGGAYLAARLTRTTEYQKWLRQARTVAFAAFLYKIQEFHLKALDLLWPSGGADQEGKVANLRDKEAEVQRLDMLLTELKLGLEGEENVIRLYLRKEDRESFTEKMRQYRSIYDRAVGQSKRGKTYNDVTSAIQALFESSLHADD